jgi:membrane protein DedA with SNARE-associated domain
MVFMAEFLSQFTAHAFHIISAGDVQDLSAVFLVACLTEFGIPFPFMIDTVLFLLGYQISAVWLKAMIVIFILFIAREAGANIVYWIFRSLGHPVIKWLIIKFPGVSLKFRKISGKLKIQSTLALILSRLSAEAPLAVSGLALRAPVTVALSRLTPGLLSLTSVASGTLRLRYFYFVTGTGIASLFSDCTVLIFGVFTGYVLHQVISTPPAWLLIIGIIINISFVMILQFFVWRRAGIFSRKTVKN